MASPADPAELSAAFAAALRRGDVEAALEMWAEDAAIVSVTGEPVRGREAIGAALRALIDNGTRADIELTRTIAAGDVAVGLGTLTLSGTGADRGEYRQRSTSTVIYSRRPDGRWQIALDAPWGLPAGDAPAG